MPEPIIFKCEDSLWQMLADGSKTFDMRRWDLADDRIYRLAIGQTIESKTTLSVSPPPVTESRYYQYWVPDEKWVSFRSKATGVILTFEYRGMEFARWAPGWCFLLLGRRME